jgi:hypothetical protein
MTYLDINPMLMALRMTPDRFELVDGWLHHIPSAHSFRLGPNEGVEVLANCDCTQLAVRPEQRPLLAVGIREWESRYWKPLLINREFASHFSGGLIFRVMIGLTGRIHRWLLERERRAAAVGAASAKGLSAGVP